MKKGTLIRLKDGKYKLFCKDREYLVFGKMYGKKRMSFNKTVTMSNLPEFREQVLSKVI